jgi:hypothetical protein
LPEILGRVGHVGDTERRKTGGNVRIGEAAIDCCGLKGLIEEINSAGCEIDCEREIAVRVGAVAKSREGLDDQRWSSTSFWFG